MLTAKTLKRTATRIRLIGGSIIGAWLFCILLLFPGIPVFIKRFAGPLVISMAVTAVIFKERKINKVLSLTGYMFVYAFLFGGMMKFLFESLSFSGNRQKEIWDIMGAGMIGYLVLSWWMIKRKQKKKNMIWEVLLCNGEEEIAVKALVDTGNSLKEPISGKPVSIIDRESLKLLQGVNVPERYRAIPYHSVGREHGIMEGYEIPEMIISEDGEKLRWQKIMVGISENAVSAEGKYQMILHPDLCSKPVSERKRCLLIRRLGGN